MLGAERHIGLPKHHVRRRGWGGWHRVPYQDPVIQYIRNNEVGAVSSETGWTVELGCRASRGGGHNIRLPNHVIRCGVVGNGDVVPNLETIPRVIGRDEFSVDVN